MSNELIVGGTTLAGAIIGILLTDYLERRRRRFQEDTELLIQLVQWISDLLNVNDSYKASNDQYFAEVGEYLRVHLWKLRILQARARGRHIDHFFRNVYQLTEPWYLYYQATDQDSFDVGNNARNDVYAVVGEIEMELDRRNKSKWMRRIKKFEF